RRGKCRKSRIRLARGGDHPADAADDAGRHPFLAAYDKRVETVLRIECIGDVRAAQAYPVDAPVAALTGKGRVGVDRLMRSMESADADMHDACAVGCWIIARAGNRSGKTRKLAQSQTFAHSAKPYSGWESAVMMPRSSASPLSRPTAG